MCLIAFALGMSSRWPLVIAANRDEYRARPTAPLALWKTPNGQPVLSGRDLRAGGAWMGASPGGRIAFLTNVREPAELGDTGLPLLISRGNLVTRWLDGVDETAAAMVEALQNQAHSAGADYAGFNLVLGDAVHGQWHCVRHQRAGLPIPAHGNTSRWSVQQLPSGVYGLSNAALDTPWPKTTRLKAELTHALAHAGSGQALQNQLWRALSDTTRSSKANLPATGVPPAAELALSSVFVDYPELAYGTRSSAVWLATAGGQASEPWNVTAQERTFFGQATPFSTAAHAMQWTPVVPAV